PHQNRGTRNCRHQPEQCGSPPIPLRHPTSRHGFALFAVEGPTLRFTSIRNFFNESASAGSSPAPTGILFIFSKYAVTSATSSIARLPGSFFGIRVATKLNSSDSCFPFHHLANVSPVWVSAV